MNIEQLLAHCTVDSLAWDEEGYDSWVPKEGTVIQMKADRDDCWYTATYIQLIDPSRMWADDDDNIMILVSQLEGLPEDPPNFVNMNELPIRIFKEI